MTEKQAPIIVWLRRDLRLIDNPALHWASKSGRRVLCVYIHDNEMPVAGGAARWWLHHSLNAFGTSLKACGNSLRFFTGTSATVLNKLLQETGADTVVWNRCYEPQSIARDTQIKQDLRKRGLTSQSFPGNYCHEPWQVMRSGDHPYRVFSAYWKASLKHETIGRCNKVTQLQRYRNKCSAEVTLKSLTLLPTIPWDSEFQEHWSPGETGAATALRSLLKNAVANYDSARDLPAVEGTSKLSPHLAFGEISPRTINTAINKQVAKGTLPDDENIETFRREIGWRDFACHLLFHYPHTVSKPLDTRFEKFPWETPDNHTLRAWQQGNTGVPLIDAGMRQLWRTGWMHNRVRMVVGSFLIKNLGYHWLEGANWFNDTLVDADLASNTMGWQWVAGSGADAAPYFRVFNPIRQGERFDAQGGYIRQWVPELANLPDKLIHQPWTATEEQLQSAGIELGTDYPLPLVDLASSRLVALQRFEKIKQKQAE